MKILFIHNFYSSGAPSGENTVYLEELGLLKSAGQDAFEYTRHNDSIRNNGIVGSIFGAAASPWNPFSWFDVRKLIAKSKPDIMHVHNTFPLISPSVLNAARPFETASVLTLHNYRLFCPAAIPMRDGTVCTDCLDRKSALPGLRYGCYRHSRLATLPLAALISLHHRIQTWQHHVDAFIALTTFQKKTMIDAGLPRNKVHVKPHFLSHPADSTPWKSMNSHAVYIGRLGEEKGVTNLIDSWKSWGDGAPPLKIIGNGPLAKKLQTKTRQAGLANKINFLGQLTFSDTQDHLGRARMLILPSLCFEGFPMVIREAFALGVPVAASRLGSLPCIVEEGQNGVLFTPGDPNDLLWKVKEVWNNPDKLSLMSDNARKTFEQNYTAQVNYRKLMKIYSAAIKNKKRRRPVS